MTGSLTRPELEELAPVVSFIDPTLLTAAERLQYEGYLRREEVNAAILARAEGGATIKEIVRETGQSRGLVRKILRGQRSDKELRRAGVTLALLWEEYRGVHPDGFGYSWFCEHYGAFKSRLRPTLRQSHVAGESCSSILPAIRSTSSIP